MIRLLACAALLLAAPALAGAMPAEHRLTPAQVEQVLSAAASRNAASEAATGVSPTDVQEPLRSNALGVPPLEIHGQVGVSIGNHGYRNAYGSAVVGLGGSNYVAVSVEKGQGEYDPYGYLP